MALNQGDERVGDPGNLVHVCQPSFHSSALLAPSLGTIEAAVPKSILKWEKTVPTWEKTVPTWEKPAS
jgi:hypothetical protein